MKQFSIKVYGVEHQVVINMNSQRRYAELIGLKYVNEVIDSLVVELDSDGNSKVSFDVLNRFGLLIHCGMLEYCRQHKTDCPVTAEDCNTIFDDITESKKAMEAIFGTMPVADEGKDKDDEGNAVSPVNSPG